MLSNKSMTSKSPNPSFIHLHHVSFHLSLKKLYVDIAAQWLLRLYAKPYRTQFLGHMNQEYFAFSKLGAFLS